MSTQTYLSSKAWADACLKGGDGQCDGFVPEDEEHAGAECGCACHRAWPGDDFDVHTVTEMAEAHRKFWKDFGPTA